MGFNWIFLQGSWRWMSEMSLMYIYITLLFLRKIVFSSCWEGILLAKCLRSVDHFLRRWQPYQCFFWTSYSSHLGGELESTSLSSGYYSLQNKGRPTSSSLLWLREHGLRPYCWISNSRESGVYFNLANFFLPFQQTWHFSSLSVGLWVILKGCFSTKNKVKESSLRYDAKWCISLCAKLRKRYTMAFKSNLGLVTILWVFKG